MRVSSLIPSGSDANTLYRVSEGDNILFESTNGSEALQWGIDHADGDPINVNCTITLDSNTTLMGESVLTTYAKQQNKKKFKNKKRIPIGEPIFQES